MRGLLGTLAAGVVLGKAALSGAAVARCDPVEAGVIALDGALSDWRGVRPLEIGGAGRLLRGRKRWNGKADLSVTIRCNYSKKHLFLAISVRDEHLARTRRRRRDDRVLLRFGRWVLKVYPTDGKRFRPWVGWGKRAARRVQAGHKRGVNGYVVELRMPLSRIPGYRRGQEAIRLRVDVVDVDWRGKVDSVMSSGPLRLAVAQTSADIDGFLRAVGKKREAVRWRKAADVVGDSGVEHVLLAGRVIGIVGEGVPHGRFFYLQLPVKRARDIYWVKLYDLNGDRKKEIAVRYIERSANGRRELVAIYRFNSANKFVQQLAQEILKGQKAKMITNRLRFVRRKRKRGVEIVVDKPEAHGYTQESFHEAADSQVHSILLPWSDEKKRVFRFEGDLYSQR